MIAEPARPLTDSACLVPVHGDPHGGAPLGGFHDSSRLAAYDPWGTETGQSTFDCRATDHVPWNPDQPKQLAAPLGAADAVY